MTPAAGLALDNRVAGFDAASFDRALIEERPLVRFWGQRNTLHLFAAEDWPRLHPAFGELQSLLERRLDQAGLRGEFEKLLANVERRLTAGEHLVHQDIRWPALETQNRWAVSYIAFMTLVRRGVACYGPAASKESRFVHRRRWLPDLDWQPPAAPAAKAALVQRYLAAYGPARSEDFGFWLGIAAGRARRWIERAADGLREVEVGGEPLWCRAEDLPALAVTPPPRSRWPVRLLYRFDPLLLATKDKSWLVDPARYKKVWLPSAQVAAVVLVRGRIAGTWRYQRKARGLVVTVAPFAPLAKTVIKNIERQARGVARYFATPLGRVAVGD